MKSVFTVAALSALALGAVLCSCTSEVAGDDVTNIVILSDVHVMAPELLVQEGSAFDAYLAKDRKMLRESSDLSSLVTEEILVQKPDYVIISGDLTKDGELISHLWLRQHCLDTLLAAGIQPLVIPGNHDVLNANAVKFLGDSTSHVPNISVEEYLEIYAPYGYDGAVARDSCSLSYVWQISPDVRLLALDACKYEFNDMEKGITRTDGAIREGTLAFIKEQLADAKAQGMRVFATMHHGLNEHWTLQDEATPGYVIDNRKQVRALLRRGGVKLVFTGHAHAQDITRRGEVYDVETGSLVSYPNSHREAVIRGGRMSVSTRLIEDVPFGFPGDDFQAYSRRCTSNGFRRIVRDMVGVELPDSLMEVVVTSGVEGLCAHYEGNEVMTPEVKKQVSETARAVSEYSKKWGLIYRRLLHSLWSDPNSDDYSLVLDL